MNNKYGKLEQVIKKIILEKYNVEIENVDFEKPNSKEHGNLSTNVALKNCKIIGGKPLDIANALVEEISKDENLAKVEVVAPGFINFYFSKKYFADLLEELYEDNFKFEDINENINMEYVSANPTGELHLGHARGAAFGDSLANLLKKVGYNVIKEYYINDAGVQMKNLGESVKAFYMQEFKDYPDYEDGYKGSEIKHIASSLYKEYGRELENKELGFFIDYAYKYNMDEIKSVLKSINVEFDIYSKEADYHANGSVKEAITTLESKGEVYIEEEAKWLATTKYGDDKDRVLEKSDKTHTYLTSDIAYHADKLNRTKGKLINVWGADHHGYVKRVKASMQSLGYDETNLEIILIQMVSILENDEKVKMSKRAGTSVTIKDLLKVIDKDVLRYYFIMRSPDTQLDFDIAKAHEQNSSNPIFYIQYAHARICSILEKEEFKLKNDIDSSKITEDMIQLIYKLSEYREVLVEASEEKRPHILTNYLYELATQFHKFYNSTQILVGDQIEKNTKLILCITVKSTIEDCLSILGIKAKDKM